MHAALTKFFEESIRFNAHMGVKVEELKPGFARLHLPYKDEFLGDPFRPALHGGVTSFLADVCGGLAVFTRIMPDGRCSTVDMRVDYLHPGDKADLIAEARVIRLGNRVAVTNIEIRQGDQVIAEARAVYNLKLPHKKVDHQGGGPDGLE
jgi:uncharacterized protein (TIGR00369 family)